MKVDNIYLPDFLIVGAPKCGTTSIATTLQKHSEIFIPARKECRFFSNMDPIFKGVGDEVTNEAIIKDLNHYLSLFDKSKPNQKLGDASVEYLLYYENTIESIKKYYPKDKYPKIIIVLRDPTKRAFSAYMHLIRDSRETKTFKEALLLEEKRKEEHYDFLWRYKEQGLYSKQVIPFMENFDTSVLFYDDFKDDPETFYKGLIDFIGVEEEEELDYGIRYNISGVPKNELLQKVLEKAVFPREIKQYVPEKVRSFLVERKERMKDKNLKKVGVPLEEKKYLQEYFKEDILKLSKVVSRDLSNWLK
ncbi:heparan sulfate glucosamine 3-O-sulfotransferase 3B1 [Neptunitalea chrysea]|uniref:Heparan sulfate glucosamine 3-O-sulfotransferase 3B1 n=1 Tax=Neptunitalea chrysea TaxID=1647581 RepID=A0A9W6EVG6_9FLAO|nr:sulfotransferase [Neptunitalea chrysea]GLB52896.1 heparan sulfate glucosamine 3-O-sulfotransferase 3B1 [Neptunitalea chrysea]